MGNRTLCCGRVCPKVALQGVGDTELYEDPHACDPAGVVFYENLEDLSEVDRLLLLFASSTNLSAVRWLSVLGANPSACDANGTTCLHAACRSGSLAIVCEFLNAGLSISTTDVANWTPLHVAVFMGRRAVSVHLMSCGADLRLRTFRGMSPVDLCSDTWLREAISSYAAHRHRNGQAPWVFEKKHEIVEDIQVSSRLRFEPFFVPRQPAIRGNRDRGAAMQQIGIEIFNRRPGQGLAFLVATGTVRDFPIELSSFLMENRVNLAMVGEFLGEDFSLSQTLRLEFINSVRLTGTGVVSSLAKVFKQFQMPSDMQKIDRLVDGVAQIWWRQHEQLREYSRIAVARNRNYFGSSFVNGEIEGLELMHVLGSYGTLHQLMFSTVLLHWSLYAPLPPSQRVTLEQWLEMNAGIRGTGDNNNGDGDNTSATATDEDFPYAEPSAAEAMHQAQCLIYDLVSKSFLPQLQIWSTNAEEALGFDSGDFVELGAERSDSRARGRALDEADDHLVQGSSVSVPATVKRSDETSGATKATVEGWGRLLGGGLPSPAGASGTITYKHIRSILSETTSTAPVLASPGSSRHDPPFPDVAPTAASRLEMPLSHACKYPPPFAELEPGFGRSYDDELRIPGSDWYNRPRGDRVWLSLHRAELFLAPKSCEWAPYAFLHLSEMISFSTNDKAFALTLQAIPLPEEFEEMGETAKFGNVESTLMSSRSSNLSSANKVAEPPPPLQMIFLLPDGRWQVLEVPRLQVQFQDAQRFGQWSMALSAHCKHVDENGQAKPAAIKHFTA